MFLNIAIRFHPVVKLALVLLATLSTTSVWSASFDNGRPENGNLQWMQYSKFMEPPRKLPPPDQAIPSGDSPAFDAAELLSAANNSEWILEPLPTHQIEPAGYLVKLQKYGKQNGAADGFRVTPYGAFWGDMIYASRRTKTGPFTLFVFSEQTEGEGAFTVDMRRSRFGMNVAGPRIAWLGGARSKGRVEIDFFGDFVTENKASVLLRHAYWEVGNEDFRLLVGQTSDVISPLYPGTLNYSVGWFGGNIGYRRAQFRAERYWQPLPQMALTLQGSLNQDVVTDFPTDPGVRRESAGWPLVESRVAVTMGDKSQIGKAAELGISGHIGQTGFDFLKAGPPPLNLPPQDDARFLTWSFNIDLRLPVSERWGAQAEFFTGSNLSTMFGGIGQGVCPCLRVPIRSTGGWFDLWYNWTDRLHSHVGYGLDDPLDRDSLFGRIYNQFIFANVTFDVSDKLLTGFEVTSWKTLYHETRVGQIPDDQLTPSAPGESVVLQWMVKYGF